MSEPQKMPPLKHEFPVHNFYLRSVHGFSQDSLGVRPSKVGLHPPPPTMAQNGGNCTNRKPLTLTPLNGPFLDGLFSSGLSRGKWPIKAPRDTAHEGWKTAHEGGETDYLG